MHPWSMLFVGLVWLLGRTRRLGAVIDSETFGMTLPADLERTLPSLQDRFAISVVHLTEYHGLGILVQRDLENGRRQPFLSPGPRCKGMQPSCAGYWHIGSVRRRAS